MIDRFRWQEWKRSQSSQSNITKHYASYHSLPPCRLVDFRDFDHLSLEMHKELLSSIPFRFVSLAPATLEHLPLLLLCTQMRELRLSEESQLTVKELDILQRSLPKLIQLSCGTRSYNMYAPIIANQCHHVDEAVQHAQEREKEKCVTM